MKKIFLFVLTGMLFACSTEKYNEQVEKENLTKIKGVSDYVPIDAQVRIGKTIDAINYGLRNAALKESSKFARSVGEVFDYEEAERLAFEYLGEPVPTKTNLVTKPLLDKEKEEIFDLMGKRCFFIVTN